MRRTRTRLAMTVAAAVILSSATPVLADEATRTDPKDTAGRLDVRRLTHGHQGDEFVHRVTMHRRFQSRMLRPGGRGRIEVLLYEKQHLRDGTLIQVISRVRLVWRNGRLRAPIFDELDDHARRRIGTAKVSRPNQRTVRLVIPRSVLGDLENPPVYLWAVATSYRDRRKCRSGCWDWAPGRGLFAHRLDDEEGG